jgi:hypothetical protein
MVRETVSVGTLKMSPLNSRLFGHGKQNLKKKSPTDSISFFLQPTKNLTEVPAYFQSF